MKLDLLTDKDLAPEREAVREPAKVWKNWWRCRKTVKGKTRGIYKPGYVGSDARDFPGKDVAEAYAQAVIDHLVAQGQGDAMEFLGAYPEGERPE